MSSNRVGGGARAGIGAFTGLSILLALASVMLINWLAARPGVRMNIDLTQAGRNTLSPAAASLLEDMPDGVVVDLFFRAYDHRPLEGIVGELQALSQEVLQLVERGADGKVTVRVNSASNPAGWGERARALHLLPNMNGLVVSYQDPETKELRSQELAIQRSIQQNMIVGDLGRIHAGNPNPEQYAPPRIASFDAEAALVEAILAVTRGSQPKIYHTRGHGEADLYGDGPQAARRAEAILGEAGFVHELWNYVEDGDLPEDCDVLSILAPRQPFQDAELEQILGFVRGGGRAVIALPSNLNEMQASRIGEVLNALGIEAGAGTICAHRHPNGANLHGQPTAARFLVTGRDLQRHSIVEPYLSQGLLLDVIYAHPLRVVSQPEQGATHVVFRSPTGTWLDEARPEGPRDNYPQPDEDVGPFDVALTTQFVPADAPVTGELQQRAEARVVVLGSYYMISNQMLEDPSGAVNKDFVRNVYNWAAEREWQVTVDTRDPGFVFATEDQADLGLVIAQWALPLLCLLLGIATAVHRSRGGPRRQIG
tara:strand:+ start:6984 stop:8603 length:1620 start_codon:yes stop_codon:yes gene_type:complete